MILDEIARFQTEQFVANFMGVGVDIVVAALQGDGIVKKKFVVEYY